MEQRRREDKADALRRERADRDEAILLQAKFDSLEKEDRARRERDIKEAKDREEKKQKREEDTKRANEAAEAKRKADEEKAKEAARRRQDDIDRRERQDLRILEDRAIAKDNREQLIKIQEEKTEIRAKAEEERAATRKHEIEMKRLDAVERDKAREDKIERENKVRAAEKKANDEKKAEIDKRDHNLKVEQKKISDQLAELKINTAKADEDRKQYRHEQKVKEDTEAANEKREIKEQKEKDKLIRNRIKAWLRKNWGSGGIFAGGIVALITEIVMALRSTVSVGPQAARGLATVARRAIMSMGPWASGPANIVYQILSTVGSVGNWFARNLWALLIIIIKLSYDYYQKGKDRQRSSQQLEDRRRERAENRREDRMDRREREEDRENARARRNKA